MSELKMPDVNNILIAGKVSSLPAQSTTTNGTMVVQFCISATRKYRDNSGIVRENLCQVGISVVNKLAETVLNTLTAESHILVEGELVSKSLRTDEGSAKNVVEIRARRIQLFDQPQVTDTAPVVEEKSPTETVKIEPTDFDFGYQNLKL